MKISSINLYEIDRHDKKYLFEYPEDLNIDIIISATKNLDTIGEIILEKKEKGFRVICGLKNLKTAITLKKEKIDCYICDESEDDISKFKFAIFRTLSNRDLNDVEKGHIVYNLEEVFNLDKNSLKDFLKEIKIANDELNLKNLKLVGNLNQKFKDMIYRKKIHVGCAIELNAFKSEDKNFLLDLIHKLDLGINISKELITYCKEILKVYDKYTSLDDLFKEIHIIEILEDNNMLLKDKIDKIRYAIKKIRFPVLTTKEEEFKHLKKCLEIAKGIEVSHYPFFEKDQNTLKINFIKKEDLKNKLKKLL